MISLTIVTVENNRLNLHEFEDIVNALLNRYFKKALLMSAFFMLTINGFSTAYGASCSLVKKSDAEKAIVKWVYDGDTLLVTDLNGSNKRKIRIIGVNTPEVKHHQQKAQLYGAKAREELRVLIKDSNYQIFLEFDKEKRDRYKRDLAHVYLNDGTNISEWLLEQGFAKTLVIPPNIKYANCYKSAERLAQQDKKRLWKLKGNRVKKARELKSHSKGYVRLAGKITDVKRQKKSLVLELDSESKKPIKLRIKKKHLKYFEGLKPNELINQDVIVSGILKNKKGNRTIYLSHSIQLERNTRVNQGEKNSPPTIKWSTDK